MKQDWLSDVEPTMLPAPEIGLRRSLGAQRQHTALQFLWGSATPAGHRRAGRLRLGVIAVVVASVAKRLDAATVLMDGRVVGTRRQQRRGDGLTVNEDPPDAAPGVPSAPGPRTSRASSASAWPKDRRPEAAVGEPLDSATIGSRVLPPPPGVQ